VPDYPVGLIWTALFALMGAARWRLNAAATPTARRAQRIIVLLSGTCLLYPFATLGFASRGAGLVGNALILILAGWAVARAWPVTRSAAAMLFPVIPWVLFASTLIGREMGWI
jgi:tryptophan-rich sensory protein